MSDLQVRHILAPVDLGHSSEAALCHARDLATRFGARLTVFYTNDALTLQSYDEIYTGYRELPDEQAELMEDAVRAFSAPHLGDLVFDVQVVADDTPRAIASAAERGDADLIVMGTHARHGWQKLMAGSVAEAVLHATDKPVLAVPQGATHKSVSTVLCPINFTEPSQSAVKAACCLSRAYGAELNIVHMAHSGSGEAEIERLRHRIREWIDPVVHPWCQFREIVSRGVDASSHILEWASKIGAGYLVLGTQKKPVSHARSTIGTTAERILRDAPLPVLSIVHPHTGAHVAAA